MEVNRNVLLPSLLTICNGACGFVALATLSKAPVDDPVPALATASWLVFLGMVFDVFDGKVARFSGGSSALGAQLDSLCDLVTFGLVPAFMVMQLGRSPSPNWEKVVMVFSLAYFLGATLRLARFTAENSPDESAHLAFKGLPTPAAAGCVASLVIFYCYISASTKPELQWLKERWELEESFAFVVALIQTALPFLVLFLGFTMVNGRMVFDHAGSWFFGRKHSFDFFVCLIFGVVLAAVIPEVVLPVLFFGYLVYKPALLVLRRLTPQKESERRVA